LKNLLGSLIVASDTNGGNEPDAKKAKLTNGKAKGDTFHILDPSFSKQGNNTVAEIPGAILSRLTLGGLVNGLAGVPGGVVDTVTCVPLADLQEGEGHETNGKDMVVPTAGGLTVKELILMGSGLHKSISARWVLGKYCTSNTNHIITIWCKTTDHTISQINKGRKWTFSPQRHVA
jgi:hypothetical protein